MSAAEFAFWDGYRRRHGLPDDRLEAATAIAGTAVCRSLGAKPKVSDLIPRFEAAGAGDTRDRIRAFLNGLKAAKSRHIPKNGSPVDTTPKRAGMNVAKPKRGMRGR